jgi:hypothetical protein
MDRHGFGFWIRIRNDNTDSNPANSHEIGQNVLFYVYTDPQLATFHKFSVPTGNYKCFSPIFFFF